MKETVTTFGEMMIRMDTTDHLRILQAFPGSFQTSFAGAEANVAAAISMLGGTSRFVTALPDSMITDACFHHLRSHGIETDCIVRTKNGRIGIYFVETGANQRPSNVIYDREGASINLVDAGRYDWETAFADSSWFHVTGITPALSETCARSVLAAVQKAKKMGLKVSCDLNFRKKLWNWRPGMDPHSLARSVMQDILPHVDVLIGNEEDAEQVLGIKAGGSDAASGVLEIDAYPQVCRKIAETYPNLSHVALTLRESVSATHNRWGAVLFEVNRNESFFAPTEDGKYRPYEIHAIVDRVGAGDSFAGSLIHALNGADLRDPLLAVRFAVAASCLAHSIHGDFNCVTKAEVLALMNHGGSGRVNR